MAISATDRRALESYKTYRAQMNGEFRVPWADLGCYTLLVGISGGLAIMFASLQLHAIGIHIVCFLAGFLFREWVYKSYVAERWSVLNTIIDWEKVDRILNESTDAF